MACLTSAGTLVHHPVRGKWSFLFFLSFVSFLVLQCRVGGGQQKNCFELRSPGTNRFATRYLRAAKAKGTSPWWCEHHEAYANPCAICAAQLRRSGHGSRICAPAAMVPHSHLRAAEANCTPIPSPAIELAPDWLVQGPFRPIRTFIQFSAKGVQLGPLGILTPITPPESRLRLAAKRPAHTTSV